MGMIQIDMQMPEKCGLCPCFHFDNPMYCQAVKADKNKKIVNPYGAPRPEWCPLEDQGHSETFIVIDNKTGEEADIYDIALHEDWAKHLCYCDMEGWAIEEDGTLLLVDECGRFEYADRERFKVKWE